MHLVHSYALCSTFRVWTDSHKQQNLNPVVTGDRTEFPRGKPGWAEQPSLGQASHHVPRDVRICELCIYAG
jgi:hypothetical protein